MLSLNLEALKEVFFTRFCLRASSMTEAVQHCRFHFYADDLQIYTVGQGNLQLAVWRVNRDLEQILQWAFENSLMLNASKTQGIVIGRRDLTAFYTLSLLNRFKKYTSQNLRLYLVQTLIIPIFLYSDVVYFPALTGVAFRRLELAFNACVMYVFNLGYSEHMQGVF
jgi:hypothetical protein